MTRDDLQVLMADWLLIPNRERDRVIPAVIQGIIEHQRDALPSITVSVALRAFPKPILYSDHHTRDFDDFIKSLSLEQCESNARKLFDVMIVIERAIVVGRIFEVAEAQS